MKIFELPIKVELIIYKKDKADNSVSFLAVKRSVEDGGFWQPVTGTVESIDTIESCIYREMEEELSLGRESVVSISGCIYSFSWHKKSVGEIYEYVFAIEVKDGVVVNLSKEHVDFRWCDFKEASDLYTMPENRVAIGKALDYLK